jgi:hypothetical protein
MLASNMVLKEDFFAKIKKDTNISGLDTVQFPLIENVAKSSVLINPKNGINWKQIEAVGTFTPLEFAEKMFPPTVNM